MHRRACAYRVCRREAWSVASRQIGSAGLKTSIAGAKVAELRYLPFGDTRWMSGTTPADCDLMQE